MTHGQSTAAFGGMQPLPQTKYWGQLQGAIQNGFQKVVFKSEPIPQALQEMQQEYQQAIGR
jgi:hypothetical protein